MKGQAVRLQRRPSRDGQTFTYMLDFIDAHGKRRRQSLGHADRQKAERQRAQKQRELRMGVVDPQTMNLSEFLADSLERTGGQIRESTRESYEADMKDFIAVTGDLPLCRVSGSHGEVFRQACLDKGNTPATVARKLRSCKRLFNLAVERGQLEKNPVQFVKPPKSSKKKVVVYASDECDRLLKAAAELTVEGGVPWALLIRVALATGMRRSELLNATWRDIDFGGQTIDVSPKENMPETWEWRIKDAEGRTLPLTEELTMLLVDRQNQQPAEHPYMFIPPERYAEIQELRRRGKWHYSDSRLKVLSRFDDDFGDILHRASIGHKTFHDLRRTALSNWLAAGMSEFDVMTLAGHSSFETTHKFYLAIRRDLVDQARRATGVWRASGTRADFQPEAVDTKAEKLLNGKDLESTRL